MRRRQVLILTTKIRSMEAAVTGSEIRGVLHLPAPDAYREPRIAVYHGWRLLHAPVREPETGEWEWWFEREEPQDGS